MKGKFAAIFLSFVVMLLLGGCANPPESTVQNPIVDEPDMLVSESEVDASESIFEDGPTFEMVGEGGELGSSEEPVDAQRMSIFSEVGTVYSGRDDETVKMEKEWSKGIKYHSREGSVGQDGFVEGAFYSFRIKIPPEWGEVSYVAKANDISEAGPYPGESYMMPRELFEFTSSDRGTKEFKIGVYDQYYSDEKSVVADGVVGQHFFYGDYRFDVALYTTGYATTDCDPVAVNPGKPYCAQADEDMSDVFDVILPTFESLKEILK